MEDWFALIHNVQNHPLKSPAAFWIRRHVSGKNCHLLKSLLCIHIVFAFIELTYIVYSIVSALAGPALLMPQSRQYLYDLQSKSLFRVRCGILTRFLIIQVHHGAIGKPLGHFCKITLQYLKKIEE
jgi:hypothetical protein